MHSKLPLTVCETNQEGGISCRLFQSKLRQTSDKWDGPKLVSNVENNVIDVFNPLLC